MRTATEAAVGHRARVTALPIVSSLSDQVYEWLKERIFTGELSAGQRLQIGVLAHEIAVSRTPVRDAINRLSLEGLVRVSPRRGTVVTELTIEEVRETFQARLLMEPSACEAAGRIASDDLIADLTRIQRDWERLDPASVYKDFSIHNRYAELDAAFHLRIVAELRNEKVMRILSGLNVQRRVAPLVFGSEYRGPARRIAEHRAIFDALSRRDPAATRQAVAVHIENAGNDLVNWLTERRSTTKGTARHSAGGATHPEFTVGR